MSTQEQLDALARLVAGYWNGAIQTEANPGGLDGDGHYDGFPAALADTGLVVTYAGELATAGGAWAALAAAWAATAHDADVAGAAEGSRSALHYSVEAGLSANLAAQWAAAGVGVEVAPGLYSAFAYASIAATAAGASGASADGAAVAEGNAAAAAAAAAASAAAASGIRVGVVEPASTADSLVMTCSPPVAALTRPVVIEWTAIASNGQAMTVDVDGLGAVSLLDAGGMELVEGAAVAGTQYVMASDGVNFRQLLPVVDPAVQAGNDARMARLEMLIAVNTLRDIVDAGWVWMRAGIVDEFTDQTGVASTSGGATYSAIGHFYAAESEPAGFAWTAFGG